MKIELIRQRFNGTGGYKYNPFSYCCNKIKDNPRIVFNEETGSYEDISPVFAIWYSETESSWGDEWENDYYYKINYCPFCGEPIEVSVVGEEDVDEQYKALEKQRDNLYKKYHKTDSKKKSEELYKAINEIDSQIDWFYKLDEYREMKS